MDRAYTVLVSAAGRRVSLLQTFRDALPAAGLRGRVIACDLDWTAPAMHVADGGFLAPCCDDPVFPEWAVDLCSREQIDLVIPTIDTELAGWAALHDRLAAKGTVVAVSSPATVAIAADKRLTNEHCRHNGIPCPRQDTVSGALDRPDRWRLPLIVKPANGSAGHGMETVRTWHELELLATRSGDRGVDLVVEELAPGVEYTVDVYVDGTGTVRCAVPRRRIEVRGGEVSKAEVVRNARIETLATAVIETLPGPRGVLNVQIFDTGQAALVIEVNARFGGGYPLTWQAGGRYSEWLVREAAFGTPPPAEPVIQNGLRMLRWDTEVFVPRG
jgi:carbamoyl-phosphate synthase large subunit